MNLAYEFLGRKQFESGFDSLAGTCSFLRHFLERFASVAFGVAEREEGFESITFATRVEGVVFLSSFQFIFEFEDDLLGILLAYTGYSGEVGSVATGYRLAE